MSNSNPRARAGAKVLLAAVLIGTVLVIAAQSLAPSMPLATLLFRCVLVAGAFILAAVLLALLNLHLGQWVLRKGGTDPQWFWFKSEPQGLIALRERQRSMDQQAKK